MDNITVVTTLTKSIVLKANQLNKKIDENILKSFKKKFEGKCISEGYVIPDKSIILKRTVGKSQGSHFTGDFKFDVLFKIEIYNPIKDNIIDCQVQKINELGIQSIMGPIQIVIPKELHNDKTIFKDLKVGNKIKIIVIARRFDLYDNVIYITGKLANDVGKINIINKSDNNIKYLNDSDDDKLLDDFYDNEEEKQSKKNESEEDSSEEDSSEEDSSEEDESDIDEIAEEEANKNINEILEDSESEDAGEEEEENLALNELELKEFNYDSD